MARRDNRWLTIVKSIRTKFRNTEILLIPLAILSGAVTGAIVTGMSEIAQLAHVFIYGIRIDVRLSANDVIVPQVAFSALASGGLILGVMEWYRRRWKISSATDPIEANALRGGRLSIRDSLIVSLQTLISNGCGASVGLEAGYTQIGSGLSSLFGRLLNLRRNDLRLMVGAGAAAAIAAAFNAPLTGAFYACELIVGTYSVASAAPILAAAISATLVVQGFGANVYAIDVSDVGHGSARQYVLMIVLACLVSLLGIVIMRAAPVVERIFNRKFLPVWLRPVVGGLLVGGMAYVTPQVLAAGHGAMLLDLPRDMTINVVALIVLLKISACLISLASGFRGGLFFASLFVGSLFGKLFTGILQLPLIGLEIDPTVSALTAMASLGTAIVGGPLTMSFLVLEMTRNLELTAGVLASCIVTSVLVRSLFGHSFSTWRLHLRGETIRGANDVGWLRNLTVERLMRSDAVTVPEDVTIAECRRNHPLGSAQAVFLINPNAEYAGIVLLAELFSSEADEDAENRPVKDLARYVGVTLLPTMNVKVAMSCFDQAEAEILAVVDGGTKRIIGFLTESFARKRYVEEIDRVTAEVFK
ncbi:MAG TPA: chloride channel protein [Bradyrhizobium sp.]|nr:chloride channel protein [Bradyrhizobium sp.]